MRQDIVRAVRGMGGRRGIAWGAAAGMLTVPLIAMQFTDEVAWTGGDFVAAAILIGVPGLLYELVVRAKRDRAYRAGWAVALSSAFFLVWINLAVGIIGSENNPANQMFAGVIAVGTIGAIVARFHPAGMRWAMIATAVAQATVAAVAWRSGVDIAPISIAFASLWLLAASLFARSATMAARGATHG